MDNDILEEAETPITEPEKEENPVEMEPSVKDSENEVSEETKECSCEKKVFTVKNENYASMYAMARKHGYTLADVRLNTECGIKKLSDHLASNEITLCTH